MLEDEQARYRPGDQAGISGVERLGENTLRGKRGFQESYRDGRAKDQAPPVDGLDLQVTIDVDLQRQVAEVLSAAVAGHPPSTGASCVVIDVSSREVLALVSVPTYDSTRLGGDYAALRDDARRRPLLFRAVAEEYQPGSILKPVALLAGFANNVVSPEQAALCEGQLIPGVDKWHCWTHWRGLPGHGYLAAEEAIQHSCNVYFYGLGQRINADRLTSFYHDFVLGPGSGSGRPRGTGLIEERLGIIPTRDWMQTNRRRKFRPADGRNYAIGQGEIQFTPLQAANMFATIAAGRYRDPTIVANDPRDRPSIPIEGVSSTAWSLTRRGLYRCVNEPGGTAYQYARLEALEICGKTGSAQCVPRVVRQRFTFRSGDGDGESGVVSIIASTLEAARELLGLGSAVKPVKREAVERYPPPDPESGKTPTHAWFAGFAPYRSPKVALTVIVEHGGSGGRTAGPVGRKLFEMLLESPRGYLNGE
jgi:penicillin-binding protein 2